jgi:hypothetical protein
MSFAASTTGNSVSPSRYSFEAYVTMKPTLANLWAHFPDHIQYPNLKSLYTMLGGGAERNINTPGFGAEGNTCASRLSIAFNRSVAPISSRIAAASGAKTLTAADGSSIIFRVADFRKYLLRTLGKPTIDNTSPYDSAFRGRRGVIAFNVNWNNATGHIALWNGLTYREPAHDNYATYVAPPNVRTTRAEFWALL